MVSSARSTISEQTWQSIKKLKQGCHGASTHIIVRPSAPQCYQYYKAPIVIKQKVIISQFRVQGIDTDAYEASRTRQG